MRGLSILVTLLVLCDLVSIPVLSALAFTHITSVHNITDFYRVEIRDFTFQDSVIDAVGIALGRCIVVAFYIICARSTSTLRPLIAFVVLSEVFFICKAAMWHYHHAHAFHSVLVLLGLCVGAAYIPLLSTFGYLRSRKPLTDLSNSLLEASPEEGSVQMAGKEKQKGRTMNGIRRIALIAGPERWHILGGIFALLISSLSQMVVPWVFGRLVTVLSSEDATVEDLNQIIYAILGAFVIGAFSSCVRGITFTVAGERLVARLRKRLFWAIVTQEIGFFDGVQSGELVNRLSADSTVIQDIATVNVSMGLRWLAQVVIGIGVLFVISWRLSLVMLAAVPPVSTMAVFYGRYTRTISKKYQKSLADAGQVAAEVLSNMKTVRSIANGERKEHSRYSAAVTESYGFGRLRAIAYGGWSGFVLLFAYMGILSVVLCAAIVLVLWYGGHEVLHGRMKAGFLTSFLLYTIYIAFALGGIADLFTKLMTAVGASERMFELMERKSKIGVEGGLSPAQVLGHVKIEDISFTYPQRPDSKVLKNISLECRPSEVVALVGRSGSGKSTIVSLLERFYDVDEGRVTIDGHDIRLLDPRWLHRNVALVAQEPVLFACSIRENITYGVESSTQEEVENAARLANAHDFISTFPDGYDTLVGERGVQLSGGQKQRVAIARAILTDPKILLLDEATSALDAESEHLVQAAIDTLMENRTVLVVAHRLSTVRNASQVIVMDGRGSIVQRGTHNELIQDKEGFYHQLVRRQLQGPEEDIQPEVE